MKAIGFIIEAGIVVLFAWMLITQVIMPAFRGTLLFPAFRKEARLKELIFKAQTEAREKALEDEANAVHSRMHSALADRIWKQTVPPAEPTVPPAAQPELDVDISVPLDFEGPPNAEVTFGLVAQQWNVFAWNRFHTSHPTQEEAEAVAFALNNQGTTKS